MHFAICGLLVATCYKGRNEGNREKESDFYIIDLLETIVVSN